jgi:hypothetical protein
MRSAVPILLAAALGVVCAVLVAACGGDSSKLIPQRDAQALKRYADRVGAAVDSQDCQAAAAAVQRAQDRIAQLPSKVDSGLRTNLEQGFQNLALRAARECQATTPTQPTTSTDTTDTTPTDTQTTDTGTTDTGTTDTGTTDTGTTDTGTTDTGTTDTGTTDGGGGTGAPTP